MRESKVALRYAKAVLNLSLDLKNASDVNDDMQLIASTIEESKELQVILKSPVVKSKAKKDCLEAIFSKKTNELSIHLIDQLIDNKRIDLLQDVAKQFTILYDYHRGSEIAKIATDKGITTIVFDRGWFAYHGRVKALAEAAREAGLQF